MKYVKRLALAYALFVGHTSFAQGICSSKAQDLRDAYECNGDKWKNAECYDLALACGDFELVAANLATETRQLNLDELYWQGMAYYGLVNRTRSTGLRCEYFTQARRSLSSYLQQALFVLSGKDFEHKLTKPDPNKVYRVTKVADELTRVKGCPEDGMTMNEIQMLAQNTAEQSVRDAFLRPNDTQKEQLDRVFAEIQDVITNASSVETMIGLKEVAAETMRSYMEDSILHDWSGDGFGTGIGEASLNNHVLTTDARRAEKIRDTISNPLYERAVALADALNRAFGGCDKDHPPTGITADQWDKLKPGEKDKKCREDAAVRYGVASDFQKKSAGEQIGIATLMLNIAQGNNEKLLKLFKAFADETATIKGVAPLKPTTDAATKTWLKVGGKISGFSTICQGADEKSVDFWFCLKH